MSQRIPALDEVLRYLDELLQKDTFSDYCPNGLQVPGPASIATVATGVSATAQLLERAAGEDADLVLVHHGLFWTGEPLGVTPVRHARLKVLYAHDMALAAYHLPLDAHPEHGNNALLADALGLAERAPLMDIGVRGTLPEALGVSAFTALLKDAVGGREPLHLPGGPDEIRTVGLVTGGAPDGVHDALAAGLDAYITGEPAERVTGIAADGGIHFFAAGHHATETFGVRRLGDLLAERFGVEHVWLDVPNPV